MLKHLRTISSLIVITVFSSFSSFGEDVASPNAEVARLRATFNKELQKIDDEELAAIIDAQQQHIVAMKALEEQFKKAGKDDSASAVNAEIERFSSSKLIEQKNLSADIPELAQVQRGYLKTIETMPVSKANKTLALVRNCDKALSAAQEKLVKGNDVDGALEAKNEREAIKQRKEVVSAELVLAAQQAAIKSEQSNKDIAVEKPKDKEQQPVAAAAAKKDDKTKKKYTGTPEKRVRQRFDDMCKYILKQDYKKAAEYVDPSYVKDQGDDVVKKQLSAVFPFVEFADDPRRKLSIDSVSMEDKDTTCSLIPKLWAANKWHELGAMKWTETEGDWYLDLDSSLGGRELRKEEKAFDKIERQEIQAGPKRFVPPKKFRRK